jgi:FAD dependent oxidoreductase TIGR03364
MVVVGAGILGTMHAFMARRAGFDVVLLDRDAEPRGATVRNFGLVWVSGRAPGHELEVALRARRLWEEVAREVPGAGFRPDGSVTVATTGEELAVLEEVCERDDAATRRLDLLDAPAVRKLNPALRGEFLAGLHCATDAVVEPRSVLAELRGRMGTRAGFGFAGGAAVVEIAAGAVTTADGRCHEGDVVVVCAGAESAGPLAALVAAAPLRRCRLQMMQTAPLGERLTTSLADGDSLRYYPAFDTPARRELPAQGEVAARLAMQLLVSQRAGGELTVGDTHDYEEPFAFDLDEAAYDHMRGRVEMLLGRPMPPVRRRWAGVYSQVTDGGICWRSEVAAGLWVVTGPGGRGMTMAPAIAEETVAMIEAAG